MAMAPSSVPASRSQLPHATMTPTTLLLRVTVVVVCVLSLSAVPALANVHGSASGAVVNDRIDLPGTLKTATTTTNSSSVMTSGIALNSFAWDYTALAPPPLLLSLFVATAATLLALVLWYLDAQHCSTYVPVTSLLWKKTVCFFYSLPFSSDTLLVNDNSNDYDDDDLDVVDGNYDADYDDYYDDLDDDDVVYDDDDDDDDDDDYEEDFTEISPEDCTFTGDAVPPDSEHFSASVCVHPLSSTTLKLQVKLPDAAPGVFCFTATIHNQTAVQDSDTTDPNQPLKDDDANTERSIPDTIGDDFLFYSDDDFPHYSGSSDDTCDL